MCGIVGYVGRQKAPSLLLEGLKRLEYRGYDSAGIALCDSEGIRVVKRTGRVANVVEAMDREPMEAATGICHTRWATHGGVTEANAHPHLSEDGRFALVHNGVVDNYESIRRFLMGKGYRFVSETDTEVLVNLIAYHYDKEPHHTRKSRFVEAVRRALLHVEGTYGIGVVCRDYPRELVGARLGSPLIVGLGDGEQFLGSDVAAFLGRTPNVVYLNDGEVVHIAPEDFSIVTISEKGVEAKIETVDWELQTSELGDYRHFMEKEIFEQPVALENALRGRISDDGSTAQLGGLNLTPRELRQIDRFLFCACGTAWHACLMAEYLIERIARIPVEVEYASEFRYRNAPLDKETVVIVVSQSGETIDTLGALREAKRKGYRVLAINNSVGSTIARESDGGIYQHAGPEIGVASTKAFTSQVLISALVALLMGRIRDLSYADGVRLVKAIRSVPDQVQTILGQSEHIREIALKYHQAEDFLFLGRQNMFPIALEGALKLKEISYIHAEGYPAAEMKHGPIALISPKCPSVFLSGDGEMMTKTLANMQEVQARGGPIVAIVPQSAEIPEHLGADIIRFPDCHEAVAPILATIPVQLMAYYIALERGCDVDKPRNLAKSVTVE